MLPSLAFVDRRLAHQFAAQDGWSRCSLVKKRHSKGLSMRAILPQQALKGRNQGTRKPDLAIRRFLAVALSGYIAGECRHVDHGMLKARDSYMLLSLGVFLLHFEIYVHQNSSHNAHVQTISIQSLTHLG